MFDLFARIQIDRKGSVAIKSSAQLYMSLYIKRVEEIEPTDRHCDMRKHDCSSYYYYVTLQSSAHRISDR